MIKKLKSLPLWKDSIVLAFVILGGIETIMSVLSITLDCDGNIWARIGVVFAAFFVLTAIILTMKYHRSKNEVKLTIRGISVTIKQGDIFGVNGLRLIPFNEYFDTQVDDDVIDRKSLNGKLILEHLDDDGREALKKAIATDDKSRLVKQFEDGTQKWRYPLGRIKRFTYNDQEYLLLAFSHFNAQNEAHTNRGEYEQTLRTMWEEIDRTYAGKPIFLPLIGTGKTRLDDMTEKPNAEFLKCLICTLRTSKVTLTAPITVILTAEAMKTVNLYELKGDK
jgi:hypothetical protein